MYNGDSSIAFIPRRQTQLNELVTHLAGSACCASPEHAQHNSAVLYAFSYYRISKVLVLVKYRTFYIPNQKEI